MPVSKLIIFWLLSSLVFNRLDDTSVHQNFSIRYLCKGCLISALVESLVDITRGLHFDCSNKALLVVKAHKTRK